MWSAFLNILVVTILLATCAPALAGLQEGLDAIRDGNYALAEKEFRRLANSGDAVAQYNLGLLYDYGQGVPQNDRLAITWYRKAAARGHAKAQFRLAVMYDSGQGTVQNQAAALLWYRNAAQQGNADAQNNLGVMYSNGQGVRADVVQAYLWFSRAADMGHEVAVRNKYLVEKKMSPQQIEMAQELAREWATKHP